MVRAESGQKHEEEGPGLTLLQRLTQTDIGSTTRETRELDPENMLDLLYPLANEMHCMLLEQMILHYEEFPQGFGDPQMHGFLLQPQGLEITPSIQEDPEGGWRVSRSTANVICQNNFVPAGFVKQVPIPREVNGKHEVRGFALNLETERDLNRLRDGLALSGLLQEASHKFEVAALKKIFTADREAIKNRMAVLKALVAVWKSKAIETDEFSLIDVARQAASLVGINANDKKRFNVFMGTCSAIFSIFSDLDLVNYRTAKKGDASVFYSLPIGQADFSIQNPKANQEISKDIYEILKSRRGEYITTDDIVLLLDPVKHNIPKAEKELKVFKGERISKVLAFWSHPDRHFLKRKERTGISLTTKQFENLSFLVNLLDQFQQGDTAVIDQGLQQAIAHLGLDEHSRELNRALSAKAREANIKFSLTYRQMNDHILDFISNSPGITADEIGRKLKSLEKRGQYFDLATINRRLDQLETEQRIIPHTHQRGHQRQWELYLRNLDNFDSIKKDPALMIKFLIYALKKGVALGVNEAVFVIYNDMHKKYEILGEKPSSGSIDSLTPVLLGSSSSDTTLVRGNAPSNLYLFIQRIEGVNLGREGRGKSVHADLLVQAIVNALEKSYQLAKQKPEDNLHTLAEQIIMLAQQ